MAGRFLNAAGLVFFLSVAAGCTPAPRAREMHGDTMGTSWSVTVVSDRPATERLRDRVQARLDELDGLWSTFRPDSEVSRFNATTNTDWFGISAETLTILEAAQQVSAASDGAFDVTAAPLVDLWGFGAEGAAGRVPSNAAIEARLAESGYRYLELRADPPAIRRQRPGLRIDLSAIAKGQAVDMIGELLEETGIANYLVEIGGEIRGRGHRIDGRPWRIALERPVTGRREASGIIELEPGAVATSGDYRNFFERDGVRYSHMIDPRTGRPVAHALAAVTVLDESALFADAWATALMVLGPRAGFELAVRRRLAARFVVRSGTGFTERMTSGFPPLVALQPAAENRARMVAMARRQRLPDAAAATVSR